eukprot:TRINITY_DN64521_c0_g1_i1.p1 TRINITY_DN64521_c0_g1~~TRINITY_DN64521_c0_g1_i1.p1  ORF type:complete len:301 (+),score=53.50 TRINITY_DN64521_c0_g1_i1:65-904(+)
MLLVLKACNLGSAIINVFLNFYFGKPKGDGKPTIASLSEAYDHVAIPAGPAFAIWGLIFVWTLVFAFVQIATDMYDAVLPALTPWFCASQLMEGFWVPLFLSSDPAKKRQRGDLSLWLSNVLLISTPPVFLKVCLVLGTLTTGSSAYWISYGVTINAAWVLLAAGLTVNICGVAAGLEGTPLSAVAVVVLSATVVLELYITGFIGNNPFNSPTAFFPVAIWALFWVCKNLKNITSEGHERGKRILPLYGSSFARIYLAAAAVALVAFVALQTVLVINKK